jgi:hypothetical protein
MRDSDAQLWIGYETRGYPTDLSFSTLGTCEKYAESGGRFTKATNSYYPKSLPELEAVAASREATVKSFERITPTSNVVENYLVKRATEEFITGQLNMQQKFRDAHDHAKSLVTSLRSSIHSYATDTYLAIELGDIAQDIFEKARESVDGFIRAHCPKAAEQLVAINERMSEDSSESRAAALLSCRRVLLTLADSLFQPQKEAWVDSGGTSRKVGLEQYKNRLLAYLDNRKGSDSSQEMIESGIVHLAARLDAIYDKNSKGVHVEVSNQEARLAVIHTYLFIGELANATSGA